MSTTPTGGRRQRVVATARALPRRAGGVLHRLLWERQPSRQVCPDCQVDFAPSLTAMRCPVCGWLAVAPDTKVAAPPRRAVRELAGVGAAWFIAAVAFALLAHALYA
jgi:rubredoxin